jgi:hypothetical protein
MVFKSNAQRKAVMSSYADRVNHNKLIADKINAGTATKQETNSYYNRPTSNNFPSKYKVTGVYYNSNKNFKPIKTDNINTANSVNLWKGNVWALQSNGKYKKIKSVYN